MKIRIRNVVFASFIVSAAVLLAPFYGPGIRARAASATPDDLGKDMKSVAAAFAVVEKNFPHKTLVSREILYSEIGYPEYGKNMLWENTCAIRVSLALVKSGINLPGHLRIKAGPHKGKKIEQGQARLSRYLVRILGEPEKYKPGNPAQSAIGNRKGIVSFYKLYGATDTQGHIDIVGPGAGGYLYCSGGCYWGSDEIWFWPLH